MTSIQQNLIEYSTQDIVAYLVEDKKLDVEEALHQLYMSATYDKLADIETGLYLQGSAYVYEMLKAEMDQKESATVQ